MKARRRSRSKKSKKSEDVSHSQPIPDEFSIDQLLATREQDVTFSQPHETESVSEDECLFDADFEEDSRFRVLNTMRSVETTITVKTKE